MRTYAIMTRVLKELIRDKRTLALMFIAPIFILILMNLIFSANQTTNITVGTVSVSQSLNKDLGKSKHVDVKTYSTKTDAKKALKNETIDAVIKKNGNNYNLTYANTDSSKTTATKMAFKNALTTNSTKTLQSHLTTATTALAKLKSQLPAAAAQSTQQAPTATKQAAPKITNHYAYGDSNTGFFNKILPILMGFFVFFFVFLISGMALLKERTSGTLDRLLATPVKRYEIVFGYMASYGILAVFQTILIVVVTIWLLGIEVVGNVFGVIVVNLVLALVALAFGILLSTFANSEFQMVQFIPLMVIPQIFFSGIIPLDSMAGWVKDISYVIPIKYSGDAATKIIMNGQGLLDVLPDIGVLLVFLIILTILNIRGLRRYRKV
ncbi:ABC-type multidrug transport system, permease component [Paucilactobacillus hokkaidonensis JCM 18461]|uniref:ABC-type multidrug transport system, permease component n=2 Tax=Paucilactobacillus hokkaidonensis TaxID=1193095 RepID=A0A0A1GU42_9LACO|nr:ABC transporter permease [Paucilactobacillus hokkaidonensis]KRO10328.1 ABC-type multidrug transport system, permease component [Paucilactobacillus hokkaidonensis]BAP85782.1 ABC-type multidrug transport system, permease component [Paucilactobacillus hokkaidonensis JCM 18461]